LAQGRNSGGKDKSLQTALSLRSLLLPEESNTPLKVFRRKKAKISKRLQKRVFQFEASTSIDEPLKILAQKTFVFLDLIPKE
jgi:hypothetical protein